MFAGTVRIECEGGFPERFLNEASKQNIALWDISRKGISLFCCCKASQYRNLRPAVRASSVRMRVCERHGLPFLLRPFHLRWGLAVGMILFVALLQLLSSRVWIVRVSGNEQVSDEAICEALEPLGICIGSTPSAVDLPHLQLSALQQLPELVWLTVNFEGSTALVEVRERQESQPITADQPANIVATRDGVIVSVDAVSGQAMVKVGDAVTKGTLLISGVMDSKVGPLLKRAEGVVTARTTHTLTVTVPFKEEVPDDTPRTVYRPCLYFLGLRIPLYASTAIEGTYTRQTQNYPLCAYGKSLPIGIEVTRLVFEETVCCTRTEDEARKEAQARLADLVQTLQKEESVQSESVTEEKTEDGITVTGTYICVESIGRSESLQLHGK